MPHGAPDWSKYRPDSKSFSLDDMAELAARLESIVTFDRLGDVVFMDSFEHGLNKWSVVWGTGGGTVEITPTQARSRGYSVLMKPGPTGIRAAIALTYIPFPSVSAFGLEFAFQVSIYVDNIEGRLEFHNEGRLCDARVRWSQTDSNLSVYTGSDTWQIVQSNLSLNTVGLGWHVIKLVVDFSTGVYKRVLLDNNTVNITDYTPHHTGSDTPPVIRVYIKFEGDDGISPNLYLDDVIVTQDEP